MQWRFKSVGVWKEEALCRSCLVFKNKVLVALLQDYITRLQKETHYNCSTRYCIKNVV